MSLQKCKLNFMILQTNLAVGSTNFVGIMNQVHYVDNQLSLIFQLISLTCCEQFHDLVSIFTKSISCTILLYFTKNGMSCIDFPIAPHDSTSTKILSDLSYLTLDRSNTFKHFNIRYALCSCSQHSSHNQIPQDCTLQIHWVCVAYFIVH